MKAFLKEKFENISFVILGFGREGQSTYNVLRGIFPDKRIHIADIDPAKTSFIPPDDLKKISFITGNEYQKSLDRFDLIIKSPGIKLLKDIHCEKITSQTSLFLSMFKKQVTGITGTKGKSTTSSLLYQIVKKHNPNTLLAGNIGIAPFTLLDQIDNQSVIILELSSHQLEYTESSPHIAILLNLYKEHLDHFSSFDRYAESKANIFRFQDALDFSIFNLDDEQISHFLKKTNLKGTSLPFSLQKKDIAGCYMRNGKIFYKNEKEHIIRRSEIGIPGDHNVYNILALISAARIMEIPDHVIRTVISEFRGLEHRLEYVGCYRGIHFYNDSIATVPEATIFGVEALKKVDTLILGGHDRKLDYTGFITYLVRSSIRNFIFLGAAGKRIYTQMQETDTGSQNLVLVSSMDEAVKKAFMLTAHGYTCLLSPAAASYDMFIDYKDRGCQYKKSLLRHA